MRIITDDIEKVHHGETKAGITMHNFLAHFDYTFNKSSHTHFKNFFRKNSGVSKWMVFSDYVLNDKNKVNDVITFSIFPYKEDFFELGEKIDKLSFKDIKKLKRVNKSFLDFINDYEILNISILLDKDIKIDPYSEVEALKTSYTTALNQVDMWINNEGELPRYKDLRRIYCVLLEEVTKQGVNLRNVRNIEIVSNLAAYLIFQICHNVKVNVIGWFSDRDAMLSHKAAKFSKPVIFDLTSNLFHNLMFSQNENYSETLTFGLPEPKGKLWYDSYNRVPDLISATLADYDYVNNVCSHDKFVPVIDNIIVKKEKTIIYRIFFEEHGFRAGYLPFEIDESTC